MAEAGEDTAKPQAQAITEVAVNGVSTEGATAAKALDNDMLEKRSEAMAEEVKAFLQDSEDEGEAGKVKGERAEDVAPPQQGEGEEDGECVENDEAPEETMAEPRNSMEDDAGASKGARSDSAAEAMAVESEGAVGGSDDGGGGVAEPVRYVHCKSPPHSSCLIAHAKIDKTSQKKLTGMDFPRLERVIFFC